MGEQSLKQQLFEELSHISAAMSSPVRLEIMEMLAQGVFSVEALAKKLGISVANTSQHLQKMKHARLVKAEKSGKQHFYHLASPQVYQLLESMINLGVSRSAELEQLLSAIHSQDGVIETIDVKTLRNRLEERSVIVVDVRPESEYIEGHIPGAWSLPLDNLQNQLQNLPADQEIIAYCRGALCTLADEAIHSMEKHGLQARKLPHGLPGWQADGLTVARGTYH